MKRKETLSYCLIKAEEEEVMDSVAGENDIAERWEREKVADGHMRHYVGGVS